MNQNPNRRDNVYAAVRRATAACLSSPNQSQVWADANKIAEQLHLDRANVSRDLNRLHAEGQLLKVQGKPTLYLSREDVARKYPGIFLPSILPKDFSFSDYVRESKDAARAAHHPAETSELTTQIGARGTLKSTVLLARAAVMYPPYGLNTLISGNVGVGKFLLAQSMFAHAKLIGRMSENAPFISVNCREFAGSPQAMLYQLFGYGRELAASKGEKGRRGLVDRASGGILCLVGVEKLPPTVLDNLITLLEKGTYTRMGEPAVVRKASTMIVAITCEPIDSPNLSSLVQRIPIRIRIPDLCEWKLSELAEAVIAAFQKEATSTGISFKLSRDIFSAFVHNAFSGNWGGLSSAVRIACSLAYAETPNASQCEISLHHLPADFAANIHEDLLRDEELESLMRSLRLEYLVFTPQSFHSDTSYREELLRILRTFEYTPPAAAQAADSSATHHIPILIWFHGEGVSENIARYVNDVLGAPLVRGISFEAGESLEKLIDRMTQACPQADRERGVLILTDMEPVANMHAFLHRATGVPCLSITNANLSLLLHAARLVQEGALSLHEIYDQCVPSQPQSSPDGENSFFNRVIDDILTPSLNFINPNKAAQVLIQTLDNILNELNIPKDNELVIRFLTHCSHMLERLIRGYPLNYAKLKFFVREHSSLLTIIEHQMKYPSDVFGIVIPTSELAYVAEIFLSAQSEGHP